MFERLESLRILLANTRAVMIDHACPRRGGSMAGMPPIFSTQTMVCDGSNRPRSRGPLTVGEERAAMFEIGLSSDSWGVEMELTVEGEPLGTLQRNSQRDTSGGQ